MAKQRPTRLTVPSPEAHAFITIADSRQHIHLKHAVNDLDWPNEAGDQGFFAERFESVGDVDHYSIAPIKSMTDSTFEHLCRIIQPSYYGDPIRTKTDLELKAVSKSGHLLSRGEDFTLDQMQAYILGHSVYAKDIPWNQLARLYNDSLADQQDSIHRFFVYCRNRSLEVLMPIQAPEIPTPDSFRQEFRSRDVNGVTEFYSEEQKAWIRDDLFHQQYHVMTYHLNTTRHFLLSTTPTLEIALAKATAYTVEARGSQVSDRMTIFRGDTCIAVAEFQQISPAKDLMGVLMSPRKLRWDFDYKSESDEDALADPVITKEQLRSLVHSVEKAFGLQWAKVGRLEDELGL